jgi:hypothetical protein
MPRRRHTGAARRLLAGAALVWLVTAAGCAGAPVAVDFDPQVEFLFYRTFVWLGRVGEPAGEPESLPEYRIHKVVADALASHGIIEGDPATADLAVRYRTGVRTEVVHTPLYIDEPGILPYRDPRPDLRDRHDHRDRFDGGDRPDHVRQPDGGDHHDRAVRPAPTVVIPYHTYIYVDRTRYFVGTLTIELIDRKAGRVVWEGTTSETVTDRSEARRPTPKAAARIMAAFPPMHR